jgi:hypothetical protein
MGSYLSESTCVLYFLVATNEAVEVAALPFPPIVSVVFVDVLESIELSVSRLSFTCGCAICLFMFEEAPAECGTASGTAGITLGLDSAVSDVLPLPWPHWHALLLSESSPRRPPPSLLSSTIYTHHSSIRHLLLPHPP